MRHVGPTRALLQMSRTGQGEARTDGDLEPVHLPLEVLTFSLTLHSNLLEATRICLLCMSQNTYSVSQLLRVLLLLLEQSSCVSFCMDFIR